MDRALEAHKSPPRRVTPRGEPGAGRGLRRRADSIAAAFTATTSTSSAAPISRPSGKWDRESIWVYPLPENVGITLDVDVGDHVKAVAVCSAAERAGLKPGDHIAKLNGYSVASFADATYALHKAPVKGSIPIAWMRDGKESSGTLEVAEGWRKTNLTWRPSMLDILPSLPFSGDDLTAEEKKALGLSTKRAAIRQDAEVHRSLKAAGVKGGDVVVGFDGKAVDGTIGDLLGFVRRNYLVGDEISINVIRNGKRIDLKHVLK